MRLNQIPLSAVVIALVVLMSLFMVACQQSSVITTLEAAISAAEVALPVIGAATGIPASTMAHIVTYLEAVNAATLQAAAILAAPGTSAEKAAAILKAFSTASAGLQVPPGTPQAVVTVVDAVVQAVLDFLNNFHHVTLPNVAISSRAKAKLFSLKARSAANLQKLRAIEP
jgi:hypothetical protein